MQKTPNLVKSSKNTQYIAIQTTTPTKKEAIKIAKLCLHTNSQNHQPLSMATTHLQRERIPFTNQSTQKRL